LRSAEVDKYFFPSYTHAQAQAFLENRPARSFLIRRSESEPGALTFVISYVKSSGNVKHHRLYYDDGLLTPQGSDESFSSIADLLYKKGFLGGGEFKLMPGNSDRQTPSPALVPRAPPSAPPATQFVAQSRVPPAGPSRLPAVVPGQQRAPAPADNYARLQTQTQPSVSTSTHTHYANLGSVPGFTEYTNLGAPDAPSPVTSYGPVGTGAVPPPNYGNVQDTLSAGDPTSNYSVLQNNHTPYTSMPSTDNR
jgi:hypothetical protein